MSAAPFEESEPHPGHQWLETQAQHRGGGIARGALRTKQHAERAAALGSELQTTDLARFRLSHPPEHCIAGTRAERLFESPHARTPANSRILPRQRAIDDGDPIEYHPTGNECRCKWQEWRCYPHTPARRGGAGQRRECRHEQRQLAAAETSNENLNQAGARPAFVGKMLIEC